MSQPAVTCCNEDDLETAAQIMGDKNFGALPVVDSEGKLVGMITDRDICMSAYARETPLAEIQVSDAMSTLVFSCRESESVGVVGRVMSEQQVRRVPVVDAEVRPVGVVSIGDVVRRDIASSSGRGANLDATGILSAICQPRQRVSAVEAASARSRSSLSDMASE